MSVNFIVITTFLHCFSIVGPFDAIPADNCDLSLAAYSSVVRMSLFALIFNRSTIDSLADVHFVGKLSRQPTRPTQLSISQWLPNEQ